MEAMRKAEAGAGLAQRLIEIRDNARPGQEPNLTSVAAAAEINRVIVSGIANGTRVATPEQAERLWRVLDQLDAGQQPERAALGAIPARYKGRVELYQTAQYQDAMGWCEYIRSHRKMGVLTGHPGSGKTTLLKEFVRRNPGTRYIECWSMMRMGDLLSEIATAAGASLSGNVYQRTRQVMQALTGREDVALVLDEAEQLRKWDTDKFEALRKIWDNTGTPVILAGTTQLRSMLTRGGGRDNLAQLYRRKYEFELTGITAKEVRAILREYNVTADVIEELTRIATDLQHGGLGNFVEVLSLCLDAAEGARIDAGILAGAIKYKLTY